MNTLLYLKLKPFNFGSAFFSSYYGIVSLLTMFDFKVTNVAKGKTLTVTNHLEITG